jgi:hypothetical protein
MYRRLDERFRRGYSQLWAGLVGGNDKVAIEGIRTLDLPDAYLDLMGLMLTYRVPPSVSEMHGNRISSNQEHIN